MLRYLFFIITLFFSSFSQLTALPAQVIIIRHAEKPPTGNDLSAKGKERAAALVPYFQNTPALLQYGPPVAIYAAGAPKDTLSKRSILTVQELARALNISLIDKYEVDNFKPMAEEIRTNPAYTGKTVLICWEHHVIPEIARALGTLQTPAKWPGETFDRNWVITFQFKGKPSFQNMPQRLMFGDALN